MMKVVSSSVLFLMMFSFGIAAQASSKTIKCETAPNSGIFGSRPSSLVAVEVSIRESRISVSHLQGAFAGESYQAHIFAPSYNGGHGMSVLTAFKPETHPRYKLVKVGITDSLLNAALLGRTARGQGYLSVDLYQSSTGRPSAFTASILDKGDVIILSCQTI